MNKIQKIFCKHKNTKEHWNYREEFKYNDMLDCVATVRERRLTCEDCGEYYIHYVQWISTGGIEEESRKEWDGRHSNQEKNGVNKR